MPLPYSPIEYCKQKFEDFSTVLNTMTLDMLKIVAINLVSRPDRREAMKKQFDAHGLDVMWFDAIHGIPSRWIGQALREELYNPPDATWAPDPYAQGQYGCKLSHMAVIQMAKALRWPAVWIFEDDVAIEPTWSDKLQKALHDIDLHAPNWKFLYLDGNVYGQSQLITPHLRLCHTIIRTPSLIIPARAYSEILETLSAIPREVDCIYAYNMDETYMVEPPQVKSVDFGSDIKK